MTRWPVLQEHPVTDRDLGADGAVSDEAIERWVASARSAYLDRCVLLRQARDQAGLDLRHRTAAIPRGTVLGRPASVTVTAGTTEVRPDAFTVAVRLRACGGDLDTAANARCVVTLADPVTGEAHPIGTDIRDELIAIEHAAQHFN